MVCLKKDGDIDKRGGERVCHVRQQRKAEEVEAALRRVKLVSGLHEIGAVDNFGGQYLYIA